MCDNCPQTPNTDQADVDGDGRGDACDPCMVKTEANDGEGSLRYVIDNAVDNACDTIRFLPEVSTIRLSDQIEIGSTRFEQAKRAVERLIIDGGEDGVTINGKSRTRVFWLEEEANVIFSHVRITKGNAEDGAGIYNDGGKVLLTEDSEVRDNRASNYGGGIYSRKGKVSIDEGSVIRDNSTGVSGGGIYTYRGRISIDGTVSGNAAGCSAYDSGGGGIYNNGGQVAVDGTISHNRANCGSVDGGGGGIYNTNSGTISIDGTVCYNTADGTGVFTGGGGIYNWDGTVTVDGTVIDNRANEDGGGILNWDSGIVTVSGNGTISGNTAVNEQGGGIFNRGTVTVNGTVNGNTAATSDGGGIFNWGMFTLNGTISGNTAANSGGGIFNNGGTIAGTVTPGTVFGNAGIPCPN